MVCKSLHHLALSYRLTSPTRPPFCLSRHAKLLHSRICVLGSPSAWLTLSPGSHMANSFAFFKTLSKCYIFKEVYPDHHHFNCKPRHPLSQPKGTSDPLYSTQLILPRAPVLLAECMMDWLVMFISCLSPPTECMLLAAGSFLTHITQSLAHGRDFINCCWIDEPAWALESNKPGFKSPLTWYSMTLL